MASPQRDTPSGGHGAGAPSPDQVETQSVASTPPTPILHRHPGQRFGSFTLKARLGGGGFGEVWKAERHAPEMLVAIKFLRSDRVSRANLARFEAEAQALARLDHECVGRILESGVTADGIPYIVMEYVEGEKITKYCDRRCLTLEQRLELTARVCEAVHHCHTRSVLHRDLKPDNILVTEIRRDPATVKGRDANLVVDREGDSLILARPKIVDFGLAKSLGLNLRLTDQTLTEDLGKVLGTLEYMAPEQTTHDPLGVDTRADVFALGVVVYELITGTLPLSHEELVRGALDEAIVKVRQSPRPDPSTRFSSLDEATAARIASHRGRLTADQLARRLSGRLRLLIGTALRREKEDRYSSVAVFARDIRNYLEDRPFQEAAREPVLRRATLALRRNPWPYAATAAVALSLLAGLGLSLWQWRRAESAAMAERDARMAESSARERAVAEADRATALSEFLVDDLLASPRPEAGGPEITVREVLDGARRAAPARFADRPPTEAAVRLALGRAYLAIGLLDDARGELAHAYEYFTRAEERGSSVSTDASVSYAALLWREGQTEEALRILADIPGEAAPAVLMHRANALKHAGRADEAAFHYDAALRRAREELGEHSHLALMLGLNIALNEEVRGDMPAARGWFERTLAQVRDHLPGSDPLLVEVLSEFARFTSTKLKNPAAAEPLYREALAHMPEVLGDEHWRTNQARANMALFLHKQRRCDEARPYFDACFVFYTQSRSDLARRQCVGLLERYANGLIACGRNDEAVGVLERAAAAMAVARGEDDPTVTGVRAVLARVRAGSGSTTGSP